jgi:hypothetical protein
VTEYGKPGAGGARYFCAEGFDALTSKASYDHRPREENITDHSALLITGITTKIAGLVPGYGAAGFDQDSGDQRAE